MNVLVTGVAGFIGFHVARALLARGDHVIGIDNINDYYDVALKYDRLAELKDLPGFLFTQVELADRAALDTVFSNYPIKRVVHLAAQAGVRYSITNPQAYGESNLVGFLNILECSRQHGIEHLVYASSSSVYGANELLPFSVSHSVDHPVSLYAATKKANELMAHSYSHLFNLPTTGLRFFTVYGPWGRPDMSPFLFASRILAGEPIDVFNQGKHRRDFTYIDDIVEGVVRTLDKVASSNPDWDPVQPDPGSSRAPWRIYNIGNNQSVELMHFIHVIEEITGRKAVINYKGMQPGDVVETCADIESLAEAVGYRPKTSIEEGMARFLAWYRDYYRV